MNILLNLLNHTKIPNTTNRPNICYNKTSNYTWYINGKKHRIKNLKKVQSMSFGKYRERFKKNPQIKEMKNNTKFEKLYNALKQLMYDYDADFEFDTITLNKNVVCKKHIDKYNKNKSYILFLGDYEGGELYNEDGLILAKPYKFVTFNGQKVHWNKPITSGTKYSIIWFKRFKQT